MKFPNFYMNRSYLAQVSVLLIGLLMITGTISAQRSLSTLSQKTVAAPTFAPTNEAAELDQCRNGDLGTIACAGSAWEHGNVNDAHSDYAEDQYLPYRMLFTGLDTTKTYIVVMGYDQINDLKHAIDYLGTYNQRQIFPRSTNTENLRSDEDACLDIFSTCPAIDTIPIPQDPTVIGATNPYTMLPIYQPTNQVMTMFGGDLRAFAYTAVVTSPNGRNTERRVAIVFKPSVANPILAWSGHVAYSGDWGEGNAAGGISGSPYHMRLKGLCVDTAPGDGIIDCQTGGNEDRSLSAAAVTSSGVLNIVKVVNAFPCQGCDTTTANTAFPFTASSTNFPVAVNFSLVDDNAGPGIDIIQAPAITAFGPANNITVRELNTFGWTASGLSCVDVNNQATFSTLLNTQPDPNNIAAQAVITMAPSASVTCTFTNSQLQITAAPAAVTGQIVSSNGYGLKGVNVTLIDISTGVVRSAVTNNFGYYNFGDLTTEDFYRITVTSRRYTFSTTSRTFTLTDDLAGVDFIANE